MQNNFLYTSWSRKQKCFPFSLSILSQHNFYIATPSFEGIWQPFLVVTKFLVLDNPGHSINPLDKCSALDFFDLICLSLQYVPRAGDRQTQLSLFYMGQRVQETQPWQNHFAINLTIAFSDSKIEPLMTYF